MLKRKIRGDRAAVVRLWKMLYHSVIIVQRDDDYLRQILVDMEAAQDWLFDWPPEAKNLSAADARLIYHLLLLEDGGLICDVDRYGPGYRMTGQGHDFLAHTRRSEVWELVKSRAAKLPGAGVDVLAKIAEAYVMQKARDLGILP